MKLQTKIPVTHADPSSKLLGGSKQGIVLMEIYNKNLIINSPDDSSVEVSFTYFDNTNTPLSTSDYPDNVFRLIGTDLIKSTSQSINGLIPPTDNIIDRFNAEVKAVALLKMAESFNIQVSDIEEI